MFLSSRNDSFSCSLLKALEKYAGSVARYMALEMRQLIDLNLFRVIQVKRKRLRLLHKEAVHLN